MNDHKDLSLWQKSVEFVEVIYKLTNKFPDEEKYGLSSQIKKAVVSIPSNIAEGAARNTRKEFAQFLYVALGSISEIETQLIIAKNLGFIEETYENDINELKKMTLGLIKSLNK